MVLICICSIRVDNLNDQTPKAFLMLDKLNLVLQGIVHSKNHTITFADEAFPNREKRNRRNVIYDEDGED